MSRFVPVLRPSLIGFAVFVACFALHIVGGALDFDPLFAVAVVLIWACAGGFPLLVYAITRGTAGRPALALALLIGIILTTLTFGATRDTGFELLNLILGAAIVLGVWSAVVALRQKARRPDARPA